MFLRYPCWTLTVGEIALPPGGRHYSSTILFNRSLFLVPPDPVGKLGLRANSRRSSGQFLQPAVHDPIIIRPTEHKRLILVDVFEHQPPGSPVGHR